MRLNDMCELAIRELEARGIPYSVEEGRKHYFLIGPGFRIPFSKGTGSGDYRLRLNVRSQLRRQLAAVDNRGGCCG